MLRWHNTEFALHANRIVVNSVFEPSHPVLLSFVEEVLVRDMFLFLCVFFSCLSPSPISLFPPILCLISLRPYVFSLSVISPLPSFPLFSFWSLSVSTYSPICHLSTSLCILLLPSLPLPSALHRFHTVRIVREKISTFAAWSCQRSSFPSEITVSLLLYLHFEGVIKPTLRSLPTPVPHTHPSPPPPASCSFVACLGAQFNLNENDSSLTDGRYRKEFERLSVFDVKQLTRRSERHSGTMGTQESRMVE